MEEVWKDIKEFEDLYKISNFGKVKSLNRVVKRITSNMKIRERILKPASKDLYQYVILQKDKKSYTKHIHRLVASAFIENPNNLPCVNHKNENPSDNNVANLEWCTYSYNNSYNGLAIRRSICRRLPVLQFSKTGVFIKEWSHAREASETLSLNKRAIYECCKGKSKTSGGFIWKRKETK